MHLNPGTPNRPRISGHAGLAALVAAMTLATAACASDTGTSGTSPSVTASAATVTGPAGPAAAERLDPKGFAARIVEPGVVLLDVRTPAEYAEGHIAGARNIDVQAGDFPQRLASLDKAASYAVYCHSGNRSQVAVQKMRAAGFTTLADLAGGITAWTAAGNPVTKS